MKPLWKDAPKEAEWLAMDENGRWVWFHFEPKPHSYGFWSPEKGWHQLSKRSYRAWRIDWKQTKERRPS